MLDCQTVLCYTVSIIREGRIDFMTDREMLEMLVEGQKQIFLRLDGVDSRLDGIDNRLDGIDVRLDGIDRELLAIKNRQDTLEGRQRLLEKKFDHLVNVDIKHLKDTQDTIVVLLQAKGIIPQIQESIHV